MILSCLMTLYFLVWWPFTFLFDDRLLSCLMTLYFLVWWPFTFLFDDRLLSCLVTLYFLVWWPFTFLFGDPLLSCLMTVYFLVWWPFTFLFGDPLLSCLMTLYFLVWWPYTFLIVCNRETDSGVSKDLVPVGISFDSDRMTHNWLMRMNSMFTNLYADRYEYNTSILICVIKISHVIKLPLYGLLRWKYHIYKCTLWLHLWLVRDIYSRGGGGGGGGCTGNPPPEIKSVKKILLIHLRFT